MKNLFKVFGIIALVAVFTLSAVSCSGQSSGGGKTLNSPEALKEYLDKQPANSPDKPIKVSMGANELMLPKIRDVLKSAGKYVSLNITGNALTTIPEEAFKECETLVGITIPNTVTSIGEKAFDGCNNLTSVTIPNTVTYIGAYAFYEIPWLDKWLDNQPDGLLYIGKVAYKYKGTMPSNTSITLLDGTKSIASRAFYQCTNLVSITIPDSVTSIGDDAFVACINLTSITIPASVTSIGFQAFFGCDKLTSVTFASGSDITYYNFGKNLTDGSVNLFDAYVKGGAGTYIRSGNGYYAGWSKK